MLTSLDTTVSVTREQYPFPTRLSLPPELSSAIFIPGIGTDCTHYYFLVDFARQHVTCWSIDLKKLHQQVMAHFSGQPAPAVPWRQASLARFIEVIHFPHSAECYGEWIYVSFIEGSFILALHAFSDEHRLVFDSAAGSHKMYSSTNQIRNGRIHFTRWNLDDTFAHEADRTRAIPLEIGTYDITRGTFDIAGVISGPDDIHATAVTSDERTYVLVEMSQDPIAAEVPRDDQFEQLPAERKCEIRDQGIHASEVITFDALSGRAHRTLVPNGPAHVEWDPYDDSVYYLSSHNLVTNNDSLYCFGNTRIDRFRIVDGASVLQDSYEADDLLRAPSHRLLTYGGSRLMAIPVFPNQVHIVNLETMSRYKTIHLSKRPAAKPDFSGGPIRYPRSMEDKTPYTVDAADGTPYLYLSSVWNVTAFDFEREEKLATVGYNRNKPAILIGHASKFDF